MKSLKMRMLLLGGVVRLATFAATNSDLKWEDMGNTFLESLKGPVAQMISVAMVIMCFIGAYMSDGQNSFSKFVRVILVIGGIASATPIVVNIVGLTGGVAF